MEDSLNLTKYLFLCGEKIELHVAQNPSLMRHKTRATRGAKIRATCGAKIRATCGTKSERHVAQNPSHVWRKISCHIHINPVRQTKYREVKVTSG